MKKILLIIICSLAASSLHAQTTLLSEDFSNGVPPSGWSILDVRAGGSNILWQSDNNYGERAVHKTYGGSDDYLVTPFLDFSGLSQAFLHFEGETWYAGYMAHNPASWGSGISTIESSIDGGNTWIELWRDSSIPNFHEYACHVDLNTLAGQSNVLLGFRYRGWDEHWWLLDNIVVDDVPRHNSMNYSIDTLWAGYWHSGQVAGATPLGTIHIGLSRTGSGPTLTRFGLVDMSPPIYRVLSATADELGTLDFAMPVPASLSGVTIYTQSVDVISGDLSNLVVMTII